MLRCASCGGFVPDARSSCPNCDAVVSGETLVWARRLQRATLIACTSVTLAACYGVPADGEYDGPWDDSGNDSMIDGLDLGTGGNAGSGGSSSCVKAGHIDVDDPPTSVDLRLSRTSVFDEGSCSLDAGLGTGLQFHAHEAGVHRFAVEADFEVSLAAFAVEGSRCAREIDCEIASLHDGVGGEGGLVGGGGASGRTAAVEVDMVEGEAVALFISGDKEGVEPWVVLHIETP